MPGTGGETSGQKDAPGGESEKNTSDLAGFSHEDYTVGWVCALPKEQTAATAMLDKMHPDLPRPSGDDNVYTLGVFNNHKVVIACLPRGTYGNNAAARVATAMARTFPSIKFGLLVGIGGGNPVNDVRLGDVVISTPVGAYSGVIQWDFGKVEEGGFKRIGALNNPPSALRAALGKLETSHEMSGTKITQYLDDLAKRWPKLAPKYLKSGSLVDPMLLPPSIEKRSVWLVIFSVLRGTIVALFQWLLGWNLVAPPKDRETGKAEGVKTEVDESHSQPREMRIHYGLIASGNSLIKSAEHRDMLNKKFDGKLLCVEMEAAGLMNDFPCLVIRGICDYADSSKNDAWQEHAAAVAAAVAKEILFIVPVHEVDAMPRWTLKKMEHQLEEVLDDVKDIRNAQLCEKDHKILDWLAPFDYSRQQNDICRKKQPGTGQWFLNSAKYQDWLATEKQTLFCPGIPGVGKTVLISTIINDLYCRFGTVSGEGIAYIYCNFNRANKEEQQVDQLLSNILKQLSQNMNRLPKALETLHDKHQKSKSMPSLAEISTTLQSVVALHKRVFIVIDALDECGGISWIRLLKEVFSLQTQHGINLIATSRPIPEITKEFEGFPSLRVRATSEDIEAYLDGCFDGSQSDFKFSLTILKNHNLRMKIKQGIIDSVDGMFLLARLYIGTFEGKITVTAVNTALAQITRRHQASIKAGKLKLLEEAYGETMDRIQKHEEFYQVARNILRWIVYSRRPLTVSELQHALGVEANKHELDYENLPDIDDITSICAGLVVVDKYSDVVRLVHYTAQDYFEHSKDHGFPDAETYIATVCINYLSFESFAGRLCQRQGEFEERIRQNRLYDYAARNWGYHAQKSSGLDSKVIEFLTDEAKVQSSVQVMMFSYNLRMPDVGLWHPGVDAVTGLHLAAFFGLEGVVSKMISRACNLDLADGHRRTPLSWAAENGQLAIGELLIENGAKVDLPDIDNRTPLLWAAGSGHLTMIELLIKKGANINATDRYGVTALHLVTERSYSEAASFLLNSGMDCHMKNVFGITPLAWAMEKDTNIAAKILLETHASVDYNYTYTLLNTYDAILEKMHPEGQANELESEDYTKSWRIILRQRHFFCDMPPHYTTASGRTYKSSRYYKFGTQCLLRRAIKKEDENLVRLLIAKGSRPDLEYEKGLTPLSDALDRGNQSIIELLIAGLEGEYANVDSKDQNGVSLLSRAVGKGNLAVVEVLLKKGANTESKDPLGCTPLCWAAMGGLKEIVKLLLTQPGIDPGVIVRGSLRCHGEPYGDRGQTRGSIRCHCESCSDRARTRGSLRCHSEPNDHRGRTPLSYAAEGGHGDVVELLLATGRADPDPVLLRARRTPLSYAAARGHVAIVKVLLTTGRADPDSMRMASVTDRTQLPYSSECRYHRVTPVTDRTPLSYAAEYGHVDVVKLLLETGRVDPDSVDFSRGLTPLSYAVLGGHDAVVELLLATGRVDPDTRATRGKFAGRTPLSIASELGHETVVKSLLSRKADPDSLSESYRFYPWDSPPYGGRTPISYAAGGGYENIVKLLLETDEVDPGLEDDSGRKPLEYAMEKRHKAIAQYLAEEEAKRNGSLATGYDLEELSDTWSISDLSKLYDAGSQSPNAEQFDKESFDTVDLPNDGDFSEKRDFSVSEEGSDSKGLYDDLDLEEFVRLKDTFRFEQYLENHKYRHLKQRHQLDIQNLFERWINLDLGGGIKQVLLLYASQTGHEAIVERLLDVGLGPNFEDSPYHGRTPLSYAAERGYTGIVERLLKAAAKADLEDCFGRTPLSYATQKGHEAIVKLLLSTHNPDTELGSMQKYINSIDKEGKTPLAYAAENGSVTIVRLLLEKGSNPDLADPGLDDETPLASAAKNGHSAVVKLLLGDSRVDRNKVSGRHKQTPLSYATARGHIAIVGLLRNSDTVDLECDGGGSALCLAVDGARGV
ncbi:hypothetical protein TWF718_004997 [Orbilia javanica]|uniref:Nucleoside phosphorylase domain-containing protein n=1 Tax=Orbilia javanica TaxID=47235 RepID=A0AAN8RR11_9PEZI